MPANLHVFSEWSTLEDVRPGEVHAFAGIRLIFNILVYSTGLAAAEWDAAVKDVGRMDFRGSKHLAVTLFVTTM